MPKVANWTINVGIFALIVASYAANRSGAFLDERHLVGALVVIMAITVLYGVLKLRQMQATFDANVPPKEKKDKKDKGDKKKE